MILVSGILNRVKRRVRDIRASTEDDVHNAWVIELRKVAQDEQAAEDEAAKKRMSDVNSIRVMLATPMLRFPKTGVRQFSAEQWEKIDSALRALNQET
jgi:hypothetical protein